MEQWNCKINAGINIENEDGSRVLIIVQNIIDDVALLKITELRLKRRVERRVEISFKQSLVITDLDLLLRVENNQVLISQIQSTTLQSLTFIAKKNAIEQIMV